MKANIGLQLDDPCRAITLWYARGIHRFGQGRATACVDIVLNLFIVGFYDNFDLPTLFVIGVRAQNSTYSIKRAVASARSARTGFHSVGWASYAQHRLDHHPRL